MKNKLKITKVFVEEKSGGYSAYIEEIPGVNAQGASLEEAEENLMDALELLLDTRRELARKQLQKNKTIREELVIA